MNSTIVRLRHSLLARNTAWMVSGQLARIVVQAGYFILIARTLGADGLGAFAGIVALAAVVAPFASWGSGNLLVKNVSRDPSSFPFYWARTLILTPLSGGLVLAAVVLIGHFVLSDVVPMPLIVCVGLSDLLLARLIDVSALAFQSLERLRHTAVMQLLPAVTKLVAAAALIAFQPATTVVGWGVAYCLATATAAAIAVSWTCRTVAMPSMKGIRRSWEWREGLYFSISLASNTANNDVDKTLLVRLTSLQSAGIYAAAYRLIDVAIVPIRSLLAASYPRFFRQGQEGLHASLAFARRLLPWGLVYGVVVGAAIWAGSPLLVHVLGDDFTATASALRWLALLPLLKFLSSLPADALTGSDKQGLRSSIQVGIVVLNVGLNLVLIPNYSWHGAAWASLISDGALAVALWVVSLRVASLASRRARGPAYEVETGSLIEPALGVR